MSYLVENNEVKNFINMSKDYVVCQITQSDSDLDDRGKMSRRDFIKLLGATGAQSLYHHLCP